MVKIISKELLAIERAKWQFADGFDLRHVTRDVPENPKMIAEFIGTDNFAAAWTERRRYEVDAGRDEEPILYTPIYDIVEDSSLPKNVQISRIGPGAVIFEEVKEGGEVKFVTVGETDYSVPIRHYAAGLEYSKDLRIYNELWNVAIVERQGGIAHNALLNNIHFSPILAYAYGAANQTAASAVGSTLEEKYLRTIEDAITAAKADTTNPRRGPYDLLIASGNMFMVERALRRVAQQGFDKQSSAISMIQNVIVYDGWTGQRGKKSVTYSGVTTGTAYLVSKMRKAEDFRSFVKQSLQMVMGNPDVSRFIEEQVIWDLYLGAYANPLRAVEEITWPTS